MQHIIKKQIIDLSLSKGLDAFHIQQRVSDYYFTKIVPLLQEAFDSASTDDEIVNIDNLVIELGTITEKEIGKGGWEEKVFKNITEQLISIKHGISSGVKVTKEKSALSISGQWIFYMQHGYLPWNVLQINQDWYDEVLETFASDTVAISNLRNLIKMHPGSVRRIVFQNTTHFLKSLIETLTAENQDVLPQLIKELAQIIFSSGNNKKHIDSLQQEEKRLWGYVLQLATSSETKLTSGPDSYRNVDLLLIHHFSIRQLSAKKVKEFLKKNQIDSVLLKQKLKNIGDQELGEFAEKIASKEIIEKESKIGIDEEGIYVSNAGVVLLHPFLNSFFKNLNLIKGEDFIDSISQLKALYLLHYLATGNTKPEEHELVIAKVLCAWPLEEPVNNSVELTDEELNEADDLLLSAIQQWSILKGTSVDGLRETFLQRKGKLFKKNDNLILQIERGSIDMLLDHLPWNLSIIKLSWMKDVLKVEWR
ncbi:MAG: contractile injection system tape measure protein [Ginsengibacter sp.]